MRLLLGSLFALTLAAIIGLGSTWFAVTREIAFGGLTLGSWTARPRTGMAEIDPYARASIARSGALPVGIGDGISFSARADDDGQPLDGRCDVTIRGTTPQARFFTLAVFNENGLPVANSLNRYEFTSQELIRGADGAFSVEIAPRARPGNWLPTGAVERYVLVLRLYDTPVGIATRAGREAPMPTIKRVGTCAS